MSSPGVSSLWHLELGLHFCATGTEGSAVPRLHTPAAGFLQHAAAATEAGSPALADHLRSDNFGLVEGGRGHHQCIMCYKVSCLAGKNIWVQGSHKRHLFYRPKHVMLWSSCRHLQYMHTEQETAVRSEIRTPVTSYHKAWRHSGRPPEPTGWIQTHLHSWPCRCKSQHPLTGLDLSPSLERSCLVPEVENGRSNISQAHKRKTVLQHS